jgi:hypothetical protein
VGVKLFELTDCPACEDASLEVGLRQMLCRVHYTLLTTLHGYAHISFFAATMVCRWVGT